MRRRLFTCILLVSLAAAAVAAQQSTRLWYRVAPEGETFAAHFPEPNYRVRRELPFGGSVVLKPASFEIAHGGAFLSVLSFAKSEPTAPKSLGAFVKGFQSALGRNAAMTFEREVKLDGLDGRQFRLKVGGEPGSARVFETRKHFYVVLTYGRAEAADIAEHFHASFTLDPAAADRTPDEPARGSLSPTAAGQPEPLWPVAGSSRAIGVLVGDRDATTQDADTRRAPLPDIAGMTVTSGGVLNGKAIAKPQPVYPRIARAARAQGTVTVQIIVDEEGYVIAASAVSGHPLLQQASVFAARQARFTPTTLEGQPVKVSGVITYNFILN